MRMSLNLALGGLICWSLFSYAYAQDKLLSIDDIYHPNLKKDLQGATPPDIKWLKDNQCYLQTRRGHTVQLWKVNARSGKSWALLDAAKMSQALAQLPDFSQAQAEKAVAQGELTLTAQEHGVLIQFANDLFYYDSQADQAYRLTTTPEVDEECVEISPDARHVGFVRQGNLYVVEIAGGQERALTSDGGGKILNGILDWLYQEELYGRGNFKGYWWSPDSGYIAYLRLDDTHVPEFTLVDHLPRLQQTEVGPYSKAGYPNPQVKLGIVQIGSGQTVWSDLSAYPVDDLLISRVCFAPDGRLVYQAQNREQTFLDLNVADVKTGSSKTLFREKTPAWVEVLDNPYFLKDGSFLWLSERSGWEHLYHYTAQGQLMRQITSGNWEVRTLYGVANDIVYFQGTDERPIYEQLGRVNLDGTNLAAISWTKGSHAAMFSPDYSLYIDIASGVNIPTQMWLHQADGKVVRAIDPNPVPALKEYKMGKCEFLQVKARDGFVMEALKITPPDFDPAKKYPVLCYTYGGPHAQQVRNGWSKSNYLWHQLVAQKGYIVWMCDNRTASGKGAQSTWPVYRNFGELELRDLEDSIAWLKAQPYVDGSRIGLWGWSYGGYLTCYALTHSQTFRIGIAGGPVTDWHLYDTIYTERYMQTPQNNPDGYKKSSPLYSAQNLSGKLLLIHGMMDDNVHMQNTIQFAYALQKAGKQFGLMLYPASRHSVSDPWLNWHLHRLMLDFIEQNL